MDQYEKLWSDVKNGLFGKDSQDSIKGIDLKAEYPHSLECEIKENLQKLPCNSKAREICTEINARYQDILLEYDSNSDESHIGFFKNHPHLFKVAQDDLYALSPFEYCWTFANKGEKMKMLLIYYKCSPRAHYHLVNEIFKTNVDKFISKDFSSVSDRINASIEVIIERIENAKMADFLKSLDI